MELSGTVVANRCHIAFFGRVNSGKSSLINAITNQDVSIVSNVEGTTTDVVKKTMEILPLGPVVLIDTAGIDDISNLGALRKEKTFKTLDKTDIAIIVVDINKGLTNYENDLVELLKNKKIPYLIVYNKLDLSSKTLDIKENELIVSAKTKENIEFLKEKIASFYKKEGKKEKHILENKIAQNDIVLLCMPQDESAPKNRLILPQTLTIREVLDSKAICICSQLEQLEKTIKLLNNSPRLVITDSQVFKEVDKIVDKNISLTSFSILFANYKGDLKTLVKGAKKIDELKDGDKILISEACTHHRQCNDIGSVKLPNWLKNYTKKDLTFDFSSGGGYPDDLEKYSLIIHCGACMLNEAEMKSRIEKARLKNVEIVNYGIAIAYMNGILKRSLEIFPEISSLLQ